jgi:hypothetical protein
MLCFKCNTALGWIETTMGGDIDSVADYLTNPDPIGYLILIEKI